MGSALRRNAQKHRLCAESSVGWWTESNRADGKLTVKTRSGEGVEASHIIFWAVHGLCVSAGSSNFDEHAREIEGDLGSPRQTTTLSKGK